MQAGYSSVGRASDCRYLAVIRWSPVRFRVAGLVLSACPFMVELQGSELQRHETSTCLGSAGPEVWLWFGAWDVGRHRGPGVATCFVCLYCCSNPVVSCMASLL